MPHHPILLIRHAEKPDEAGAVLGVDESGHSDPRSLSVRGWQRAGALVGFFAPCGLAGVFATAPRPHSRRPQQTVTPLAAKLGLPLQLLDSTEALVAALAAGEGPAVVCWRHDDIPAMAAALLGDAAAPSAWTEDCFDAVWRFEQTSGNWHLTQQPQRLLPGDAQQVIT